MKRSIVDELNREVDREMLRPFVLIPAIIVLCCVLVGVIVRYADEIDTFFQKHWQFWGWLLVGVSLALIVRREIKRI